jgi:hypothetical protein
MRIMTKVGDLNQRTGDGQAQIGYLVAGRSGGQITPCAICIIHKETRKACLLVWPQNQSRRFISVLASKPVGRVFQFGPQNR